MARFFIGERAFALAGPPFAPPKRPRATALGSAWILVSSISPVAIFATMNSGTDHVGASRLWASGIVRSILLHAKHTAGRWRGEARVKAAKARERHMWLNRTTPDPLEDYP